MCSYGDMVANRYLNINSESRVSAVVAGCYYPEMNLRAVRLANLHAAITRAGGIDALAEAAQVSRKYLEQILSGFQGKKDKNPRAVGNTLADKISNAIGESAGWMDQPHPELWEKTDQNFPPPISPVGRHSYDSGHGLASISAAVAEPWPFPNVAYKRVASLSARQREELGMALLAALTIVEGRNPTKKARTSSKAA